MKTKTALTLVDVFIRFPIWFYLVYVMLRAANPDRLVWFLFYIYIPVSLFSAIIAIIVTKEKE